MAKSVAIAATNSAKPPLKLARLGVLALRIYLPCLLATPFAFVAMGWLAWGPQWDFERAQAEFLKIVLREHDVLLAWSAILFVGAVILGLPLAKFVCARVSGLWARVLLLVFAGTIASMFLMMFFVGLFALIAGPVGGVVALFCSLANADRLRQPTLQLI